MIAKRKPRKATRLQSTAGIRAKKKPRGRPFSKGKDSRRKSGGRAKGALSITTRVRATFSSGKAPGDLVAQLKKLTRDPDPRVRLAAIKEVIDRSDGKAQENVNLTGEVGLRMDELKQNLAGRRAVQWVKRKHPAELRDFLTSIGVTE
jgi:hypothetical protein